MRWRWGSRDAVAHVDALRIRDYVAFCQAVRAALRKPERLQGRGLLRSWST